MSEFDFISKSKKLLRQLNWYMLHIFIYLVASMTLVYYIYQMPSARWPWLFAILLWTVGIIVHGLRINDIYIFRGRKRFVLLKGLIRLGGY